MNNRRFTITLYIVAVCFFWASQYIYLPTLPTYVQTKTGNLAAVGIVLSMYGLWQVLIRIPLGIAADWLGWRKPFSIVGLGLAGLGAWILGTSNTVDGLALGRAIAGVSTGTWVVLVVAFSALFPSDEAVRASSLIMIFNSLGRIVATSIAGSLTDLGGYTLPFMIAAILGLMSAAILLPVHEPRRASQTPSLRSILGVLKRPDVLSPSLLSAVGQYALWTGAFGFFTVLAKQLGATNVLQSAMITIHITLAMIGSFLTSWRRLRIHPHQWVYAGYIFLGIGITIAALAPSLTILMIAPAFTGFGMGISYAVLMGMSIIKVRDEERTIAMSLHQTIYAVGMFVGPAVSGTIADAIGLQPMFRITAFITVALGISGMRIYETMSQRTQDRIQVIEKPMPRRVH